MIRIYTDFHWKNTDFPHEIVACLAVGNPKKTWQDTKLTNNIITSTGC